MKEMLLTMKEDRDLERQERRQNEWKEVDEQKEKERREELQRRHLEDQQHQAEDRCRKI